MPMTQDRSTRISHPVSWRPSQGAWPEALGTRFRVWGPRAATVEVVLERPGSPARFPLAKDEDGTFGGLVEEAGAGDRYRYRVDGLGPFPDPASRFQPEGVHGPSQIIDPSRFAWTDDGWGGIAPEEVVLYELHVGTFSPEGTFEGVTERLPMIRGLGVSAIELMPVADFAGNRNWGYDGVNLFAPARCYGTPDDLRRLIDTAHGLGLAVFIDAVYNHFGPSGNYTGAFSPHYLSDRHKNPWGDCVNLDGLGSAMVREFFIENAQHWVHEYHVDGFRLDATHALIDDSPRHFLAELADRVRATVPDPRVLFHAEDHRNLHTMIRPPWAGGWDLDGVWADDFHHQVRRHLAGDNEGYYRDYTGSIDHIVETINQGWFYSGQHSVHLDEPRGTDPVGIEPHKFVTCLQNHDQVGNRAFGERLHHQVDLAAYRAATALWLCAPQTPLLFMGQEWASSAPFLFFTDHEEDLGALITEGRRREFRHFLAFVDPDARERIPDPQARSTFDASRLDWSERDREPHASTLRLYQALLNLRRTEPALRPGGQAPYEAVALDDGALGLRRDSASGASLLAIVRLRGAGAVDPHHWPGARPGAGRRWELILTTEDALFAPDSSPICVDPSGPVPMIDFGRPSAILFRAIPT